jgi:hypothetical protein
MNPSNPMILQTGYCTNVHAGRDFAAVIDNLHLFSHRVWSCMHASNSDKTLGVGLWFSELSAIQALESANLEKLRSTLANLKLAPFTLNGFPQGDFHQKRVKHQVYLPTWWEASRANYTSQLIRLLDAILPEGMAGSISTLPIAWGTPQLSSEQQTLVVKHWMEIAQQLDRLKQSTGRHIVLAVEPEPGCILTDSASFRSFYLDRFLAALPSREDRRIAQDHITLCHDVCHAAVMFEDQSEEIQQSIEAGIRIGKVQVSSAVAIDWQKLDREQREASWSQLAGFVEERYLHQTHIETSNGERLLVEDLPDAIASCGGTPPSDGKWRIHFHVPIYLPSLGALDSTQSEISRCWQVLVPHVGKESFPTGHFEVETYAWTVLPKELQVSELSKGIAKEMQWFESMISQPLVSVR